MTIGYFVNVYPKVSHTFIRREIEMLEKLGKTVHRFALRSRSSEIVDASDERERDRTDFLLDGGVASLLLAIPRMVCIYPRGIGAAVGLSLTMMRRSNRSIVKHIITLCEAAELARRVRSAGITHIHAHFGHQFSRSGYAGERNNSGSVQFHRAWPGRVRLSRIFEGLG